jgi:hypothetical protein
MVTKQGKMIGRIQVAESMGFEVYEPGGGTRGLKNCGWHDTGRRRGGKGQWWMYAMRLWVFWEIEIREFVMRKLFTSRILDITMYDELLLLWVSPPGYFMAHTTTSL